MESLSWCGSVPSSEMIDDNEEELIESKVESIKCGMISIDILGGLCRSDSRYVTVFAVQLLVSFSLNNFILP